MYGRRELLESLTPYKVRPAPNELPGKWMTGTQNHECIAGVLAAIDYLAALGRSGAGAVGGLSGRGPSMSRREALVAAFGKIAAYERPRAEQLQAGFDRLPQFK